MSENKIRYCISLDGNDSFLGVFSTMMEAMREVAQVAADSTSEPEVVFIGELKEFENSRLYPDVKWRLNILILQQRRMKSSQRDCTVYLILGVVNTALSHISTMLLMLKSTALKLGIWWINRWNFNREAITGLNNAD
jgi:hypothetical protein